MRVALLRNEDKSSVNKWKLACEKIGIEHDIIDITSFDWLDQIAKKKYNFLLLRPPGMFEHYKLLYDERIYTLTKLLGYKTFPSYEECYIYENKKLLSYFLKAKNLPHPKTFVFYSKLDAENFVNNSLYPLVAKTSIGSSGTGVQILKSNTKALTYVNNAFSQKGIRRQFGPNRVTGSPSKWFQKAIQNPSYFFSKLHEYFSVYKYRERDFVIFQEYIPHDFEWRSVKIGNSYFAHKKSKVGEKASGSKGIDYVDPPEKLLEFTRSVCDSNNFNCMAIDLFEDGKGGYIINELQTIFGHVQNYILSVDNMPGRYLFEDGQWRFEKGNFNTNESYDLRLKVALDLYGDTKENYI